MNEIKYFKAFFTIHDDVTADVACVNWLLMCHLYIVCSSRRLEHNSENKI
jgi:hypothetical protein